MGLSENRAAAEEVLASEAIRGGYRGLEIVHGADLAVRAGEVVCLLGANGSGKSTLLKLLIGSLPLMSGQVIFESRDISRLAAEERARAGIGYVPQLRNVFDGMTARENLQLGGYSLPPHVLRTRMDEVLGALPIVAQNLDRNVTKLSGGERRLVGVARALMLNPRVLILDEPTAGLAPKVAHELLEVHIRQLAKDNRSVILVEQRAREAIAVADWVYVMRSGNISISASKETVLAKSDIARTLLGAEA